MAQVVFKVDDGVNGMELWVTDGTEAGTQLLADIRPGSGSSNPAGFASTGDGRIFFSAIDPATGREFRVTDGTEAGTSLVKDLSPGTPDGNPFGFAAFGNGQFMFRSFSKPMVTDGTAAGTFQLTGPDGTALGNANNFTPIGGGRIVFSANDGTTGTELWITDGTAAGTQLVRDINVGASGSYPGDQHGSADSRIKPLGDGRAVFTANDGIHGTELWVTDGTAAGTVMLADIQPGATSSNPAAILPLGDGRALFNANTPDIGRELWVTDGTQAGTYLLKDIRVGISGSNPGSDSYAADMVALGDGRAVFGAFGTLPNGSSGGYELWITDGTPGGTVLVKDIIPLSTSSNPKHFLAIGGGEVLFQARTIGTGAELWITDGTEAGTVMVKDINPGTSDSGAIPVMALGNGGALVLADDGTNGLELWITDGTEAGTRLLKDITPGASGSYFGAGSHEFGRVQAGPFLSIAPLDANRPEGSGGLTELTFQVTRSGDISTAVLVDWSVGGAGPNPADADDFGGAFPSGTLMMVPGQTTATISVQASGDSQHESDEGFAVTLATAVGATIAGGTANGTILNDDGIDVTGSPDADLIQGTPFDDTLSGGDGDDTIEGLAGDDLIFGNAGDDLLQGGGGDDDLRGGAGRDTLYGGGGNDVLRGGGQRDTLYGGAGDDTLDGGDAADLLYGGADQDLLVGGKGDDTLYGEGGDDTLQGEAGDDLLDGGGGNDLILGGGGRDTALGGSGNDTIFGGGGDDVLQGDDGRDQLSGGGGDDQLFGGKGADTLDGGKGNDTLSGGKGADVLTGGAGADTFVFSSAAEIGSGSASDRITDFTSGRDVIDLSGFAQPLEFIGTAGFSGTAGEIRFNAGTAALLGDIDGDGSADFRLWLDGVVNLDAGDLIL